MRPTTFLRQPQVSKNIYMQNNVYKNINNQNKKAVYVIHYKCRESPKYSPSIYISLGPIMISDKPRSYPI